MLIDIPVFDPPAKKSYHLVRPEVQHGPRERLTLVAPGEVLLQRTASWGIHSSVLFDTGLLFGGGRPLLTHQRFRRDFPFPGDAGYAVYNEGDDPEEGILMCCTQGDDRNVHLVKVFHVGSEKFRLAQYLRIFLANLGESIEVFEVMDGRPLVPYQCAVTRRCVGARALAAPAEDDNRLAGVAAHGCATACRGGGQSSLGFGQGRRSVPGPSNREDALALLRGWLNGDSDLEEGLLLPMTFPEGGGLGRALNARAALRMAQTVLVDLQLEGARHAEALRTAQSALESFRAAPGGRLRRPEAAALNALAKVYLARNEPAPARAAAKEALALRQDRDAFSAMQTAKQAVARFQSDGDRGNEALALQTVAKTHMAHREFLRAARVAKEAQQILAQLGVGNLRPLEDRR
eukprot:g26351.t1